MAESEDEGSSSSSSSSPSPSSPLPRDSIALPNTLSSSSSWKPKFEKTEVVRLIGEALREMGYMKTADQLQAEAGILPKSEDVSRFKALVLSGEWGQVEKMLSNLAISSSLTEDHTTELRFLVHEQRYLELVEKGLKKDALACLRGSLTPLKCHPSRVHLLSSLVVGDASPEALKERVGWLGSGEEGRAALLARMEPHLSRGSFVPRNRLTHLLEQALAHQCGKCLYHNTRTETFSLMDDHVCPPDGVPRHTVAVLRGHDDEVWCVQFSPNGRHLASASKDRTVIVWDTTTWAPRHVLRGHQDAVWCLAWSPDSSKLITCGGDEDKNVVVWDPLEGAILNIKAMHSQAITSCAWHPDGLHFATGSTDNTLCYRHVDGHIVRSWSGIRTCDLSFLPTGSAIVVADYERKIRVLNLKDDSNEILAQESGNITSLTLNHDGTLALVSILSEEGGVIRIWDISRKEVVHRYTGQTQKRYTLRSCFGGSNDVFVVSGSEDFRVHVWHRPSEALVAVLEGHTSVVNGVAWHPLEDQMFASCSDDKTVRVWSSSSSPFPPYGEKKEEKIKDEAQEFVELSSSV